MRLRHIKGAEEQIAESPYVIQDPQGLKGKWHEFFGNQNPVRIEVGMGKGKFIMELAEKKPDVNYIGIERYSSVLLRGLQKRSQLELSNIYFMRIDALELADVFDAGEVDRIYLNFSDPWPKDRHAKRRLTSDRFLPIYDQILKKDGIIEFKTDNQDLFRYSLGVHSGSRMDGGCPHLRSSQQRNGGGECDDRVRDKVLLRGKAHLQAGGVQKKIRVLFLKG